MFPVAGIPAALSDERTWSRFAAARDRVEADPDALAEIRAGFSPVEDELWAVADAIAATDTAAMRAYTATVFESVEAALARLSL